MSKLFDDFDLDIQKIKNGIQPRDGQDGSDDFGGNSGSDSLTGISTWSATCTETCLFCKK